MASLGCNVLIREIIGLDSALQWRESFIKRLITAGDRFLFDNEKHNV